MPAVLGHGATRISASLGEIRLNFHKVTHGLGPRPRSRPPVRRGSAANKDTVLGFLAMPRRRAPETALARAIQTMAAAANAAAGRQRGGDIGA